MYPPTEPNPYDYGLVDGPNGENKWSDPGRQRIYRNLHREWKQYQTWTTNRNPKRAKLEAQFGYDTKYAAHLVRLLDEAEELLLTGHLTLPLKSAYRDHYLHTLNGCYSYEDVVCLGERSKDYLQDLEKVSSLPKYPNRSALENLLIELHLGWIANAR
jgi:hypothetical protein